MFFRSASQEEEKKWNDLIAANPDSGHFLQSKEWGEFKMNWGWIPFRFIFEDKNGAKLAIQALKRKTPLGWIWYFPKGPGLSSFSLEQWPFVLESLRKKAEKENALLIKFEPEIIETDDEITKYRTLGLIKSKLDLQFKATTFINLRKNKEEILAGFKQKTRYNIRLAQKNGITVKIDNSPKGIEIMYGLYAQTGSRANFYLRPKEYTTGYWKKCIESGLGNIFIAEVSGEPLAGLFAYHLGKKIWYKDGGSSRDRKELMAPYALQWHAIEWAKDNGFETYDMVAVPPKKDRNEKSPWWGLYRFKSGFNSNITEFVGCLDLPIKKYSYSVWRKIEPRYIKVHQKIFKNAFY